MSNPGAPANDNPLAAPPQPPALPDGHGPVEQAVGKAHTQAAGQLAQLTKQKTMVGNVKSELDKLSALGESVTPEDVIKGAGLLVGKGADPMAMASLLADMPQGGQALAAWLQQHDTQLAQNEQQLDQMLAGARHQAGSAALHVLAMDHIKQKFGPPMAAPQQGDSNGLAS